MNFISYFAGGSTVTNLFHPELGNFFIPIWVSSVVAVVAMFRLMYGLSAKFDISVKENNND